MLTSSALLAHYDPTQPLVLSCDASQYGVRTVLSQVCNGDEKPVAYASRILTTAERNYSQLEKEGLALIYGVRKFHNFLFGRFTLCTDHKPLQSLLNESKPIPCMASAHIQRWALTLASYEYTIKYKSGPANTNADALSRLPPPNTSTSEVPIPSELVLLMEHMSTGPLTAAQVKTMT